VKAYVTKRYGFPASHRLHCDELSADRNRDVYGKCNNPHGHGHNYELSVTLGGPINPRTGMVCDLGELDGFVTREIMARYDHANLNLLPEFEHLVPTTENLCRQIERIFLQGFKAAQVERVHIQETRKNSFSSGLLFD
jgi:6-pyruvoyltetrahydropterin/6-carboxytetrahydropterin synthase